jgi:hypothetical protein
MDAGNAEDVHEITLRWLASDNVVGKDAEDEGGEMACARLSLRRLASSRRRKGKRPCSNFI